MLATIQKLFKEHLILNLALLISFILYSRFLFFGSISWDDPEMVFANTSVKAFNLRSFFTNHYVGNYIPITMLVHAIAWFLFGANAGGHHFIVILFHLLNGILVYQLGKRLFKNNVVSGFGALIFLLHPLQIESVGWISELKNVLSGTFYMSSILFYLKYKDNSSVKNYGIGFLMFVLGCLSKSSVVVLPLVLMCVDIYLDKKIIWNNIWNKIPFLFVSIVIGLINIQSQTADQFINHAHEFPIYQRIGFAGFGLLKYLGLFLFPTSLSVIYPYPEIKIQDFVLGYLVLISLLSLVGYLFMKKSLIFSFLIMFILLNLILVLQFLPFGEVLYADRYLYIPIIGLGWILGILISKFETLGKYFTYSLLIILGILTYSRIGAWKSALNLYEDILKKYPEQFIALNSAGVESMFLNEDEKALNYLNKATHVAPRNYKGFYNRGLLYLKNNQADLAIISFNESLALYDYSKAYTGRAAAYYLKGDIPKAMQDAGKSLEFENGSAKAHFVLANCYNDLNKLDEALEEYNTCIKLSSTESDFYFKRAIVYGKKQDFKASLSDLTVCIELQPDYYEAYYWKGVIKINLKQNPCEDLRVAAGHNFEPAIQAYHKYCQ